MAAKLLHSLADDNQDLEKQIGCMTGILQIFDRQNLISGRRPNQRRLLPPPQGNSKFSNGDLDGDSNNGYGRDTMERNPSKYLNEKQRPSTESSRASLSSSSRSSSFSSLDCGKTGQPEPSSNDRIIFPENPSRDPVISQTIASPKMGRLSVDIRDVVKDSMYRDSRTPKEDGSGSGSGPTFKNNNDSPRTLQLGVGTKGNSMAADIKESLRVLAKLRDVQLNYNEKEFPRLSYDLKEGSLFPISNDAPRYSYDGREINPKNKDFPRLSLDSRESEKYVHQPPANQSRPSSVVAKLMGLDLLPDSKRAGEDKLGPIRMFPEERGPTLAHLRVPDSPRPVRLPKSPRSNRKESTSPRWRNSDGVMKPVSSSKFPIEPAPWKHIDGSRVSPKQGSRQVKPTPSTSSTSPSVYGEIEKRYKDLEFKQSGKDLRALKQILEAMQAKGFLEATKDEQSFGLRDRRDHDRRIGSEINGGGMNYNDFNTNRAVGSKQIRNGVPRSFESPIVIMKPAKLVQKSSIPSSNIIPVEGLPALQRPDSSEGRKNSTLNKIPKDQIIKEGQRNQPVNSSDKKTNNRKSRANPTSSRSSHVVKDNNHNNNNNNNNIANSSKNPGSGSVSPRLQQKKLEFDKRARPPTPPSDLNKSRRQPSKQSTESGSPGGRRRVAKTSVVQQNVDQSREKCENSRDLRSPEDSLSVRSDMNSSLEPRIEREGTFTKKSVNENVSPRPSKDQHWVSEELKEDVRSRFSEDNMVGDLASVPEQPSPVSVLDSCAYMEGSPSPVKQSLHNLKVSTSNETGEELWSTNTVNDVSTQKTILDLPSEISRQKLQSIDNLVQKLRQLNSTHDEAQTDYIASLCENKNPDHRYISEILVASGLLLRELSSGLTSFQLHPSGHPINPELFFVLEQTKVSGLVPKGGDADMAFINNSKCEKFHRKLIFDAVNEILAEKLTEVGPPPEPWLKPEKLAKKTLNAQKLLRELCSEIEHLQARKREFVSDEEEDDDGLKDVSWEDVMQKSESWTDFRVEHSSIVLDVERSIFKDLVNEIVIGEAWVRPKRNRRKLNFSK